MDPDVRTGDATVRGPGRPRRAETDRSIGEAALRLLREAGPSGVTVEAVAAESGVAKTTIYRRHADRESVLRAALAAAVVPPDAPVGDTPRERIRWALDQVWGQMTDVLGRGGLAAILRDDDPGSRGSSAACSTPTPTRWSSWSVRTSPPATCGPTSRPTPW